MVSRRHRQYIGLAVVILAYVGGIIGWSWAVCSLDPATAEAPADTTSVYRGVGEVNRHVHATSAANQ